MAASYPWMLPHVAFGAGLFAWLVGLPGVVMSLTGRALRRRCTGFSFVTALVGAGLLLLGAIGVQTVTGTLLGAAICGVAWLGVENRVISRRTKRPVTMLLTEMKLQVVTRLPEDRNRLVLSMTREGLPEDVPVVTLRTVRSKWAGTVLDDAARDEHLDQLVRELEMVIVWTLTTRPPVPWLPTRAAIQQVMGEVKLTKYANVVISRNTGGHRDMYPSYRGYSPAALYLAAVCRLAADPTVLFSIDENAPAGARP